MTKTSSKKMVRTPPNAGVASVATQVDLQQAVGNKIRALRQRNDLAVGELARAAGIASSTLSRLENGSIAPSLATLRAVSSVLQTPISSFFDSFDYQQSCCCVQAGHGVNVERRAAKSGHIVQRLGSALSEHAVVEPYLITLRKHTKAKAGSRDRCIEFIYMLKGELHYRYGPKKYHLKEGDSLLFDTSIFHGPDNHVEAEAVYLSVLVHPRSHP